RSGIVNMAKSRWALVTMLSTMVLAIPTPDSQDAFIIEMPPQEAMYDLPYYLLLLCAIAILCWGLAYQFASPLNRLAETVRRFGAGDLTARVRLKRSD